MEAKKQKLKMLKRKGPERRAPTLNRFRVGIYGARPSTLLSQLRRKFSNGRNTDASTLLSAIERGRVEIPRPWFTELIQNERQSASHSRNHHERDGNPHS